VRATLLQPFQHLRPKLVIKWLVTENNTMAVFSIRLHNLFEVTNPIWLPDNLENALSSKGPDIYNEGAVLVQWVRHIPEDIGVRINKIY
jgi:hypothetical protein